MKEYNDHKREWYSGLTPDMKEFIQTSLSGFEAKSIEFSSDERADKFDLINKRSIKVKRK